MSPVDAVAIISALKAEVATQSTIIKNALVLIQQFAARVAADKAEIAALEAQIAAVPDVTTTVQADTKSLSDTIASFSASGQLNL